MEIQTILVDVLLIFLGSVCIVCIWLGQLGSLKIAELVVNQDPYKQPNPQRNLKENNNNNNHNNNKKEEIVTETKKKSG